MESSTEASWSDAASWWETLEREGNEVSDGLRCRALPGVGGTLLLPLVDR